MPIKNFLLVPAVILGGSVILGSWYSVDEGSRGVVLRNGAITGIATPGLSFKVPLIDKVVDLSVRTHVERYKLAAYSSDQQAAEMEISVTYRLPVDQISEVYANFGDVEGVVSRLVKPHLLQETKVIFGQFTAVKAIQSRALLNSQVFDTVKQAVDGPVIIEGIQIENIDFSDAYETSIEQRMLAEVEVQKYRQQAEREKVQAEIVVTQAKAKADSVRAEAQAQAEAITLRGNAEASAIKAKAAALNENSNLISLTAVEKWSGQLPTTMVPGSAVPFISVK